MNKILNKLVFVFLILFFVHSNANSLEEKIKIGVLIPMTGDNKKLCELIVKATRLAIKDINNDLNVKYDLKENKLDLNIFDLRIFN